MGISEVCGRLEALNYNANGGGYHKLGGIGKSMGV
jgi:hypothetical protein